MSSKNKIIDPKDPAFRFWQPRPSRREFISTMGMALAGVLISRYGLSNNLIGLPGILKTSGSAKVAATLADNYDSTFIRQRIEHLFDSLGGISDVVQPGDKVGIKINLTGGSGNANNPNLHGIDIRECMWTHPEVLRAVGELLIDSGVSGNDIYIVEAIWDDASFYQFGYSDVMDYLGASVVNLNVAAPYTDFIVKSTGSDYFFYDSFIFNGILDDIDVFVSIPKMKQHYTAGVTHSMKNLIGSTPLNYYQMPDQQGTRSKLHVEGGDAGFHLPRSICDLNMARPIHLAVIDGVKNAVGGEGPWNPTFEPHEDHYLLAGKNAVSTDSIASYIMGNDPEPAQLLRPDGTYCDNHLWLASQKGLGTNIMSEIELVGDGAGSILGIDERENISGENPIILYQNYPNPFRSSTTIRYYLHDSCQVSLVIYNLRGQEISRLVDENNSSGEHIVEWNAGNLQGGVYYARLSVNGFSQVRKMNLVR
jgi:uncharacterized protein (DUF362 family)